MIGNNTLILCKAEMCAALQLYLNSIFIDDVPVVGNIEQDQNSFHIDLIEKENN